MIPDQLTQNIDSAQWCHILELKEQRTPEVFGMEKSVHHHGSFEPLSGRSCVDIATASRKE